MIGLMLSIEEFDLGYLKRNDKKYAFISNASDIKNAKQSYPYDMKLFKLCDSGAMSFDTIPYPFSEYLSCCDRQDIKSKAGITDLDDEFEKLYKIAALNIERIHFTIKQYNNLD